MPPPPVADKLPQPTPDDPLDEIRRAVPGLAENRHQPVVAAAHASTRTKAEKAWVQRTIVGHPLKHAPGVTGVYVTPFHGEGAAGDLRRYLRLSAEDVVELYGLDDPAKGQSVFVFTVHARDKLEKQPSTLRTGGEEAVIGPAIGLAPVDRLALYGEHRTRNYVANDPVGTTVSVASAVRLVT